MRKTLITITILVAALASCRKDKGGDASDDLLAGFQVGTSVAQPTVETAPPAWLFPIPACPAESLPERFQESDFDIEACSGVALNQCLKDCQGNKVGSCYAAAIVLQQTERSEDQSTAIALFARACQLGDASGCTNWAASMDDPSQAECVRKSFAASCLRGHDPWGCTMYARALVLSSEGTVAKETLAAFLEDTCRFGQDDPACESLKSIIAALGSSGADAGP